MAIALDDTAEADVGSSTSLTYSHTCTGSDRLLVVCVATFGGPATVTATYDGVSMTEVDNIVFQGGQSRLTMLRLAGPSTGANNIVITASESDEIVAASISYTGCHQSDFTGASGTNQVINNTDPTLSSSLSSGTDEQIVSTVSWYDDGGGDSLSADSPLTEQIDNYNDTSLNSLSVGDRVGAASAATDWTITDALSWGIISKAFIEAAAGGANPKGPLGLPLRGALGGPI